MKKLFAMMALAGLLTLTGLACSDDEDEPPSVADGVTEVVRQLLAETTTDRAPGQLLELTRVIIPGNQSIAPHTHPGPQLAVIVAGELTYTVIDGEAIVTRATATNDEEDETYSSGDSFRIGAGDAIYEPPLMVHKAENDGDEPVIIYLSSLFTEGEPAASPVE